MTLYTYPELVNCYSLIQSFVSIVICMMLLSIPAAEYGEHRINENTENFIFQAKMLLILLMPFFMFRLISDVSNLLPILPTVFILRPESKFCDCALPHPISEHILKKLQIVHMICIKSCISS